MKENIYEAIKLQSGKITFKNLSKKFDIDTEELKQILLELKLDGEILQLENKYMIFPPDLNIGTIVVSASGKKYLAYNSEKISIAANFFNDVILHDVVSFKLNEKKEAEIFSIVDRPLGKMTCEVISVNGKKKVIPYHSGVYISLPSDVIDKLFVGDIILVEIIPNNVGEYCNATFIKKVGRRDDPLNDDIAIALNYEFDNEYDEDYMNEIKAFPTSVSEKEIIGRTDYRMQNSFTIDGANTKDMDDGVYGEMLDNGLIRIYVHIADVSHYVKDNSLVFKRACEKTTSLYMNNSVFHMLHYVISNGICSLNPNADRLTKTVVIDIDENGNVCNFNIVKSVINSKKKMVYEDVDEILINGNVPEGYENFVKELTILNEAAQRLEKRYTANGKITFANDENNITYNNDGTIKKIEEITYSPSRKLIENMMIAANETVAGWFYNMGIPTVYRIHELPNIYKINMIIDKVNQSGFHIKHINNADSQRSIQLMLDKLKSYDEFKIISQLMVMSMQRARYSTENYGHYALGLDAYLHFTSPIRRLADLLVHMMTDIILEDYNELTCDKLDEKEKLLHDLANRASRMQRQADMAEAEAERRLIIQKLEKLVGHDMEAIICETDKKIRVKLFGIDTYIDKRNLANNFNFDPRKKLYYDMTTGKCLTMGTRVTVRLVAANSANRSVNILVTGIVDKNVKKKVLIS